MGEKLKELREKAGMTMEELADKSGVHRNTIWNIENGNTASVMTATVARLAEALEVPVSVFFT